MVLDDYSIIFNPISKKHQIHALLCSKSNRIITISNWSKTIQCLNSTANTHVWYNLNIKKIPKIINLNLPFECVYDLVIGTFNKIVIDEDDILPYLLLSEKSSVFDFMHKRISIMRLRHSSFLPNQQEIYKQKYKDALNIMEGKTSREQCYVKKYAVLMNIDETTAAKQIIDKHNLNNSFMEFTEDLRMRYTKSIIETENLFSLNLLYDNMHKELAVYGRF